MTIMNQLSQQIQRLTKRKRRRRSKRDGRSFWQPDGTKEVRNLASAAWLELWQAPPPLETTNVWRKEMKLQKQAILQSHRRPLNGHRYPGRKNIPPRKPGLVDSIIRSTAPTRLFTDQTHQVSLFITNNVVGPST